jgi:hypothetical protein
MINILLLVLCLVLFAVALVFGFWASVILPWGSAVLGVILMFAGLGLAWLSATLAINVCKDEWWFSWLPIIYLLEMILILPPLVYYCFPDDCRPPWG